MPDSFASASKHYHTIEQAIRYITANVKQQPTLGEIAASVNLSEFYLQRLFTEWAGVSPKRFLQYLTKEYAKQALRESMDVLTAAMKSGLSSPGRLHDLMINCEAMTPGEIKAGGYDVTVTYGITITPFGMALIAWTTRGICKLAFFDHEYQQQHHELALEWPAAVLVRDDGQAAEWSEKIFTVRKIPDRIPVLLRGTNYQIKVWEALLNIGSARMVSYSTLAGLTDSPKAKRSVGTALAANNIAYLIPCHRVIRESGDVGIYRWGSSRKAIIQAWEAVQSDT